MKKLLFTTAIVAVTSLPAIAQNTENMFREQSSAQELHASDFIGMRIYRADSVEAESTEGVQDNWDDIGEVNDVIFSRDGNVEAVLVDIGGFLGMGENQVAVDMDSLRFVSDSGTPDQEGDFFLVLNAPRDALENAPSYGRSSDRAGATEGQQTTGTSDSNNLTEQVSNDSDQTMAAQTDGTNQNQVDQDQAALTGDTVEGEQQEMAEGTNAEGTLAPGGTATDTQMSEGTGIAREGYVTAPREELVAEDLTGAAAYDANDERIGEVSELLLAEDGKIKSAIIDVGGFLGIGEKPVELELSKLDILRTEDGSDVRVYISMTEEELEALPEYEN